MRTVNCVGKTTTMIMAELEILSDPDEVITFVPWNGLPKLWTVSYCLNEMRGRSVHAKVIPLRELHTQVKTQVAESKTRRIN